MHKFIEKIRIRKIKKMVSLIAPRLLRNYFWVAKIIVVTPISWNAFGLCLLF